MLNVTTAFFRSWQSNLHLTQLFWVIWHNCHWHWHHLIPLVLVSHDALGSVSVSHDTNSIMNGLTVLVKTMEMICSMSFGHVTPLVPVADNANSINNGTITLLRPTQLKCNMTFLVMWCCWCQYQHHMMLMKPWMEPLHFLGYAMSFTQVSSDAKQHCQWHHSFIIISLFKVISFEIIHTCIYIQNTNAHEVWSGQHQIFL